jgi:hypothetical protein
LLIVGFLSRRIGSSGGLIHTVHRHRLVVQETYDQQSINFDDQVDVVFEIKPNTP